MAVSFVICANIYHMKEELKDFTTAERFIYTYIAAFMLENKRAPTAKEITAGTGCSEKTWERTYRKMRGLRLIKPETRYILSDEAIELARETLKPQPLTEEEE